MDVVRMDMSMGVKMWRTRTVDRTEWAAVVRESKAEITGL
jgi:hypothetical protein